MKSFGFLPCVVRCPSWVVSLWVGCLWIAVGSVAVQAQEVPSPWPKVFEDQTDVSLVNLDVFVRHADGTPVSGLTLQDFTLRLDGQVVPIKNFYAVEGGRLPLDAASVSETAGSETAEVELPRRLLILYVDTANLSVSGRGRAFDALRQYLLDNWDDDLDVLVAGSGGPAGNAALHVIQGLTQIPHEVFVALQELQEIAPGGQRFAVEERQLLRELENLNVDAAAGFVDISGSPGDDPGATARRAENEARSLLPRLQDLAQLQHDHMLQSLQALEQLIDLAGGVPRRTSILYIGDQLDLRPGQGLLELFAERTESIAGIAGRLSVDMETGRFDGTPHYLELVNKANAGGITLYGINASPPASLELGGASAQGNLWSPRIAGLVERNRRESQHLLADGTGGKASRSASDVGAVLAGVVDDFDHYYSVGFTLPPDQNAAGDVRVRVQRADLGKLEVRSRGSLELRSSSQTMAQRALAALLLDSLEDPLGVELQAMQPSLGERGLVNVPLRLEVPLGQLVLVPEGKEHRASVSLYVAARDGKGRTSRVLQHRCPIRISNSELLMALGRSAVCGVDLQMLPLEQSVAVVVHDEHAARTATVRIALDLAASVRPEDGESGGSGAEKR